MRENSENFRDCRFAKVYNSTLVIQGEIQPVVMIVYDRDSEKQRVLIAAIEREWKGKEGFSSFPAVIKCKGDLDLSKQKIFDQKVLGYQVVRLADAREANKMVRYSTKDRVLQKRLAGSSSPLFPETAFWIIKCHSIPRSGEKLKGLAMQICVSFGRDFAKNLGNSKYPFGTPASGEKIILE